MSTFFFNAAVVVAFLFRINIHSIDGKLDCGIILLLCPQKVLLVKACEISGRKEEEEEEIIKVILPKRAAGGT